MRRQLNLNIRPQRQLMHSNTRPHRLRLLGKEPIIHLIHGGEVVHIGQKDIDLNNIIDAASCGFEDLREIGYGLGLSTLVSSSLVQGVLWKGKREATNSTIPNTALNQLHTLRLHPNTSRAINHAITLNSLREEGHRRWCLVGEDGFFERHFGCLFLLSPFLPFEV
jgi:hypothetical protein